MSAYPVSNAFGRPRAPITLLLIDDNPDQLTITKRALRGATEYIIENALDAPDGLEKIPARSYDVILCDYRLPSMSGIEVLKQLEEHEWDIPFILITVAGSERVAVEAMQHGAYDYIVKDAAYEDVLPGVIQRAIDRHLEKQDRKRLEAERDQAQAALQVSYEQLKTAQQQAIQQERLRALGQMASGIAHDFNNALAPILGFTELLLAHPEDLQDTYAKLIAAFASRPF